MAAKRKNKKKPYSISVASKPIPKGRPRMTRYGRVFTPEGTTVTVTPVDGTQSKLRGDLDNYVKLLMDGLNGVAWLDDKQVIVVRAEKR